MGAPMPAVRTGVDGEVVVPWPGPSVQGSRVLGVRTGGESEVVASEVWSVACGRWPVVSGSVMAVGGRWSRVRVR